MAEAREEYTLRLAARRRSAELWERAGRALWWTGALVAALLLLMIGRVADEKLSAVWLWLPASCLALTAIAGRRVRSRAATARLGADFYQAGLDRLDGQWGTSPFTGEEWLTSGHVYAHDLDIVGERSLFARICTARTTAGAEALARWLLASSPPESIRQRHEAIRELRDRLDLREALAIAGGSGHARVESDDLAAWAARPAYLPWRPLRPLLLAVSTAVLTTVAGMVVFRWPIWPCIVALTGTALVSSNALKLMRMVGLRV